MHGLAYGACTFAYITLYPEGAGGNRMLLNMQQTAQRCVIKLVEHCKIITQKQRQVTGKQTTRLCLHL